MRMPTAVLVAVAALVLAASPAGADDVLLNSGETVTGTVLGEAADVVILKLPDGSTRRIPKAEVKSIKRGEPPPVTTPPVKKEPKEKEELTPAQAREKELRDAIRPSLEKAHARPETFVPVKAEGEWVTSPRARVVDIDKCPVNDRSVVDFFARALEATSTDARAEILKEASGSLCWGEFEVTEAAADERGGVKITFTTFLTKLMALRQWKRVTTAEAKAYTVGTTVTLPVLVTVSKRSSDSYLESGLATFGYWIGTDPVGSRRAARPDERGARSEPAKPEKPEPATAPGGADAKAEAAVVARVRSWLLARRGLQCLTCSGKRILSKGSKNERVCTACTDGLSSVEVERVRKRFGVCGSPIAGNDETVRVKIDGAEATVTALVKSTAAGRLREEESTWAFDGSQWVVRERDR